MTVTSMKAIRAGMLLLALQAGFAHALEEQEQRARIEFETKKGEYQIEHSELLFKDPELNAYLQEVTDRLFPDIKGKLHVRALRDPNFNAFAVATGGVYFNTGTLLRLDDESQLASVLGHEGTHYTGDHMYRSVHAAKSASVVTLFAELTAVGFGIPPDLVGLVGYSSMMGFSRAYEREADRGGFDRMSQAGYDLRGGALAFERLDRELTARYVDQGPYFFASHPNVKERVENLIEFGGESPTEGEKDTDRYLAVTLRARLDALAQIHRGGDGRTLVFLLEDEKLLKSLPPEARYYLAEGFRLRAEKAKRPGKDKRSAQEIEERRTSDAARAVEEYRLTMEQAPDYAPTYGALAMQYYRIGDKSRALELFQRYVELNLDQKQTGYARQYIELLSKELTP
jgi:Zn-dependent protease with chaperone function